MIRLLPMGSVLPGACQRYGYRALNKRSRARLVARRCRVSQRPPEQPAVQIITRPLTLKSELSGQRVSARRKPAARGADRDHYGKCADKPELGPPGTLRWSAIDTKSFVRRVSSSPLTSTCEPISASDSGRGFVEGLARNTTSAAMPSRCALRHRARR